MAEKKKSKKEIVQLERTPKKGKIEEKDKSTFKLKEEHFEGRVLTYLDPKNSKEGTVPAIHRNLNVGGLKVICLKGEFLSKEEVNHFNDKAKAAWLEDFDPEKELTEDEKIQAAIDAEGGK